MQVILSHEHADFDALASLLGAHKLFPDALPVLPRSLNRNLRDFLVLYGGRLPFRDAASLPREPVERAIFVDSQTAQFVRGMRPETPVRIIDHHARERELPAHYRYEGEPLAATTSLLVERLARCEPALALEALEATLLLLGIYEDSGRLSYVGTTARDLRAAAWLLEQGARLELVDEFLRHPLSPAQSRLFDRLRAKAEALQVHDQPIVLACASADAGEPIEEISALAQPLLDLWQPAGLLILVDLGGHLQLVARSRSDRVDVGGLAERLGGGGHRRAAAAVARHGDLAGFRAALLAALPDFVQPPIRVADLMRPDPETLSPELSIAEAEARMRALGHAGYPVVEAGRLLGLITRDDVDRAIRHDRHKQPLREAMRPGPVSVHPEDPLRRLRATMLTSGWGQIPVVDASGALVGIVTRSDLLRLWNQEDGP